jgi:hypothetical protein
MTQYRYRPEILDQLAAHGIMPKASTSPDLVHEYVNDLYRYELRRLRRRLLDHEFLKTSYFDRVVELRRKYPLLSIRRVLWVE